MSSLVRALPPPRIIFIRVILSLTRTLLLPQVQLLDASDPEAAENASMALWTVRARSCRSRNLLCTIAHHHSLTRWQLSRNLKLRDTIHRAGALEPLMKILSAGSEEDGPMQVIIKIVNPGAKT
jgi:hypothetical protein